MKFFITFALISLFSLSLFAQTQAEVIATTTFLRSSPDVNAEKVRELKKGEKIFIENGEESNGWIYVSTTNRKFKGWLRRDFIQLTAQPENVKKTNPNTEIAKEPTKSETSKQSATKPETSKQAPKPETNKETPKPISPAPTPNSSTSTPNATSQPPTNTLPTPAATPESVNDDETLSIETVEVNLNVRVVDGKNRPVNNLRQTDFKVYEDGVLQPITSIATTEVPIINALVIDNSRSLRTQLKKVIDAGKIIVGTNRPADESSVVRFVSTDKIEVVQDFTPNKDSLNNALDNLFVEGGQTAIIDAIYQTAKKVEQYQISQKKEDAKLRALILVSDGDDRGSRFQEKQLFDLLRDSSVQIYAIGFINDLSSEPVQNGLSRQEKAKAFLTRLAEETGGKVYLPNSIEELTKIAADISAELRTQYLISYTPTNEKHDGSFRQIKVEINEGGNKEKRTAITRAGRNAPTK